MVYSYLHEKKSVCKYTQKDSRKKAHPDLVNYLRGLGVYVSASIFLFLNLSNIFHNEYVL